MKLFQNLNSPHPWLFCVRRLLVSSVQQRADEEPQLLYIQTAPIYICSLRLSQSTDLTAPPPPPPPRPSSPRHYFCRILCLYVRFKPVSQLHFNFFFVSFLWRVCRPDLPSETPHSLQLWVCVCGCVCEKQVFPQAGSSKRGSYHQCY